MSADRPAPNPKSLRGYDRSEPGFALAGYLLNVEGSICTCQGDLESAKERRSAEGPWNDFILNARFVACQEKYAGPIEQWHAELVESAKGLGLLPEVSPLLERMRVVLETLWDSAAASGTIEEPSSTGLNVRIDTSRVRGRIAAAVKVVERLRRLWSHFDPAADRVDEAIIPWERAYSLAIEINDGVNDAVQTTEPNSIARIRAMERVGNLVERDLPSQWNLAVTHAFSTDLGKRINTVCRRTRDAARRATAEGLRVSQRGDPEWATKWTALNNSVVAMQDLYPLLHRAVRREREKHAPKPASPQPRPSRRPAQSRPPPQRLSDLKPKKKPKVPTRAESLRYAAQHWFSYDTRKLKLQIAEGGILAARVSANLWHFDLRQVGQMNPEAADDARLKGTPRRKKPRRRAR